MHCSGTSYNTGLWDRELVALLWNKTWCNWNIITNDNLWVLYWSKCVFNKALYMVLTVLNVLDLCELTNAQFVEVVVILTLLPRWHHEIKRINSILRMNESERKHQPYIISISTVHQPYINRTSTIHQPYINHSSTVHQPYINRTSTIHHKYIISTS